MFSKLIVNDLVWIDIMRFIFPLFTFNTIKDQILILNFLCVFIIGHYLRINMLMVIYTDLIKQITLRCNVWLLHIQHKIIFKVIINYHTITLYVLYFINYCTSTSLQLFIAFVSFVQKSNIFLFPVYTYRVWV